MSSKKNDKYFIYLVFLLALIIRLFFAAFFFGFVDDIVWFDSWAERMYMLGPGGFYSPDFFSDYPPLYLYVLYGIGTVVNLFSVPLYSSLHLILLKFPAILCDLIICLILYVNSEKKFNKKFSLILSTLYLFNPVIILNCSVWGQVDSVLTLFVVLFVVCLNKDKHLPAFIFFCIGILVKPQMLIFSPLIIIFLIDRFLEYKGDIYEIIRMLISGVASVALFFLLAFPFGIKNVFSVYTEATSTYPFASTNAYNFWAGVGLNLKSQDYSFLGTTPRMIGTFCIVIISVCSIYIGMKMHGLKNKYSYIALFLIISVFTFSVQMHERYVFPAFSLLLLSLMGFACDFNIIPGIKNNISDRKGRIFLLLAGIFLFASVINFFNTQQILFRFDYVKTNPDAVEIRIAGILFTLTTVALYVFVFNLLRLNRKIEIKYDNNRLILLAVFASSFVIPAVIAGFAYFKNRIYPGSSYTILIYDMKNQLLPLYGYLSNESHGFNNLFHTMSGALGGNMFGTIALYLSPFDLIYYLFPAWKIPDVAYYLTIVKIGLCGFGCSVFLSDRFKRTLHPFAMVLLSCCYSLMSFNIKYSMSPMWLDAVMMLPILVMFAERLIKGKKSLGFILVLTFCIISDYYMAYMVVIALTLYFVMRMVEEGTDFKAALSRLLILLWHGLLSVGLSAFLLIPVILDFGRGKFQSDLVNTSRLFINSLLDVLSSFKPLFYTPLASNMAPPLIYCGSITVLLSIVGLLSAKKKSAIMGRLAIVIVYILSFIIAPMNRIWHGFTDPVGFPIRYAFTFVFFIICFAAEGFIIIGKINFKVTVTFKRVLTILLSCFVLFELYLNSSYILSKLSLEQGFANRSEFYRIYDMVYNGVGAVETLDDIDDTRLVNNFFYTNNDGWMYGYNGLGSFSSSYNKNVIDFLSSLGVATKYNTAIEYGITPPVAGLLNVGYVLSNFSDYSDSYDFVGAYSTLGIYKNDNLLPFGFVNDIDESSLSSFSEDPFENINILYSELCEEYRSDTIFKEVDCEIYYPDDDGKTAEPVTLTFSPGISGTYWVFAEKGEHESFYSGAGADEDDLFGDIYLNGEYVDFYDFSDMRICSKLGVLTGGNTYTVQFGNSKSGLGNIKLYYFDSDLFNSICDAVQGYSISYIDKSGMVLDGELSSDSTVVFSLPYENGYRVYIDGEKTNYDSYRDALISLSVPAGKHLISIKYLLPGLGVGMAFSIFSFFIVVLYIFCDKLSCFTKSIKDR